MQAEGQPKRDQMLSSFYLIRSAAKRRCTSAMGVSSFDTVRSFAGKPIF
jgi:hypothetical protein